MKQKTKHLSLITLICLSLVLFSTSALAVEEDQTAPTMTGITVEFQDGTTVNGTSDGIECAQGQIVKSIKVTMSEPVSVASGAVVQMKGTSGECAVEIPNYVTYGTITPDTSDTTNKTIIIMPSGSNDTAGYCGEMTFKAADGAVTDLSDNACTQAFVLTVQKVLPSGDGITPATGADIDGEQTFTFPFTTTAGALLNLELDLYLGDSTGAGTGESRVYDNAVQVNLPANANDLNKLIDQINFIFMTKTRAELVTDFGEGNAIAGEYSVRFFEAAGFRVGQDKAATVKSNIQYTSTDTTNGTWTLKLNTYMLRADKLEILTQVENSEGDQWGNNNYTQYGDLTKAFLYNLTLDEDAPTVDKITVTYTDGTTGTGTDALYCDKGQVVKSIKVAMNEPVTLIDSPVVTMIGTAGDCADKIPSSVTYGTIALDETDETGKTLIITPSGNNGTAGYLGEVVFSVAADSYQDELKNKNENTSFKLNVGLGFDDVGATQWFAPAITFISARGITVGVGNDLFAPNAQITRAEFLVMLMRAFDIAPAETWTDNFDDAGTDKYYSGYLAKAKELEIIEGVGNNLFAPNQKIIREEMFTMLCRALDKIEMLPEFETLNDLSGFGDTDEISTYALESIKTLVTADFVHGDNNMLRPLDPATRAQTAQVFCNILSALEHAK